MTDILITGGAGVVGRKLCAAFLSRGLSVRVLTLPGDKGNQNLPKEVEVFEGDVTKPETLTRAFENVKTVCHLAAIILSKRKENFERINLGGTKNVIAAAKNAQVQRFLFVSSISVTYPVLTDYGKSKFECESLVKNCGIPFTIVRPTLVVEENGAAEYMLFVRYLKKVPMVFLPGGGKCLKRPVRTEDLVEGIAQAATVPEAIGKIYALAGSKILSMKEMAEISLKRSGLHKKVHNLPLWICHIFAVLKQILIPGSVSAKQAIAGFRYDAAPEISLAENDLNYHPKSPF